MTEQIPIPFSGEEERSGPLTKGQENILRALLTRPDQVANDLIVDLPAGTTVEQLTAALRSLLVRHESLRTRYTVRPEPRQWVAASGELMLRTVDGPADRARALAEQVRRELWWPQFDLANELSLRVAAVGSGARYHHLVAVVSHMATDGIGVGMMVDDLHALLAGRELPPRGLQPLDLAELEARPEISRRINGSRRYWADRLRRAPHSVFPFDAPGGEAPGQPGLLLRSRPAAEALRTAAERTRSSRSTVVMSALTVLLARYSDIPSIGLTSSASNRIHPQLRDYAGTQSTDAFIHIEVAGANTFDEIVGRVTKSALLAYRNSWYDADQVWQVIHQTSHSRGIDAYTRDCLFNDISATGHLPELRHSSASDPLEEFADGSLAWLDPEWRLSRLALSVYRVDEEFTASLWADPRCLSRDDLRAFGRDLVHLLVRVGERDAQLPDLLDGAELVPADHQCGWYFLDRTWVQLAAVRRLLAKAVGGREFWVAVVDDPVGDTEPVIECHVADPSGTLSPETIHEACVALLPGRSAAMTPHRYVLCDRAPGDPGDPAAWRRLAVSRSGSGRMSE